MPIRTHKTTVVWQWLQATRTSSDRLGSALGVLKKRVDMPHRFPHKRYLYDYLLRAKVPETTAEAVIEELWKSYRTFNERVSHSVELTT